GRHSPRVVVLLVADMFHPVHSFSIEPLLNRDVGQGGGGAGAVPMLLAGREPDHIAGTDFFDRTVPSLRESVACRHDQRLSEWMRVPGRAGTGLERHTGADDACRVGGLDERINPDDAGEVFGWTLARGL